MTALTTPGQIALYRLCTLRSALRLEIAGMRRSGRSAYALLKDVGYAGNRSAVLAAVTQDIAAAMDALTINEENPA
jgi:hypothetical protein